MRKDKNIVILEGRAGKDPEFKTSAAGEIWARLSMVTDSGYMKDGIWKESKQWHTIVCFQEAATQAQEILKGDRVMVIGQITYFQDKEDKKRQFTNIKADSIAMIERSRNNSGGATAKPAPADNDDDIPF